MASHDDLSPAEHRRDLLERHCQLVMIDSHEEAGNLTAQTASRYRLHVLRGGNVLRFPLDGPNAPEAVRQWEEADLALADCALRYPNVHAADAEARRLVRRVRRGDRAAAFVRLAPSPERQAVRPTARSPRRRSVRSRRAKARAPDDPDLPRQLHVIDPAEFSASVDSCLARSGPSDVLGAPPPSRLALGGSGRGREGLR
jgi:hypothetical protein